MKRSTWILLIVAVLLLFVVGIWFFRHGLGPLHQDDLAQLRIYAYRDWQSIGVQVQPGDRMTLRARGTWLYTPGEYHGPEGHKRYRAPDTYPINAVPGGVLLGRVGESGPPFIVGSGGTFIINNEGFVYLRINDDILSDNKGFVVVDVMVVEAEAE